MPEVRCSVCGMLAPPAELNALPRPDPNADAADFVCGSCVSKLSAEISVGHTTILRPETNSGESGDPSNPVSPPPEPALDVAAHESGESVSVRAPSVAEFDFAKKKQFGSYELLGEISRGSFGVVYKAKQAGLDRIVALKVLLDGMHASPEAIERFQREAKSVARLKHPNVVPIYDIGTCDGHHYFAMEFIEGHPLSAHILARGLTIPDSLAIAEKVGDAMECAHRAGVIHRDIKPSNIIIDRRGEPHITDFGLAKQVDLDNKYTMSGTTLGTPAYMPPEQARGQLEKIDGRSDVYALGTVLYEMLTGVTPFSGRSLLEVVVAVINEPVPPPRNLNPRIHRDIQTIVLKCLEKEQSQRYATAADLRDDLRRFRSGEAIVARPAGLISRGWRFAKRQKWYIASAACVVLAMGVAMLTLAERKTKNAVIQKREADITEKEKVLAAKEIPKWYPEWIFKDSTGLQPGPAEEAVYDIPQGRLSAQATQISPESERFYRDFKAEIYFTITPEAASLGFVAGVQSTSGTPGIPFVLEVRKTFAKLWGPVSLYAFENDLRSNRDAQPKLEVKLEEEVPQLTEGGYILSIDRIGTRLKFVLQSKPGQVRQDGSKFVPWGPASLEVKDYNLSHWYMKYTQLVLRQPPPGMLLESGEVKRKLGGPAGEEVTALTDFYAGEYKGAIDDFKALSSSVEPVNAARAKYHLGLITEICLPAGGDIRPAIRQYLDAKLDLERMKIPAEAKQAAERAELMRDIHMRLIVCYSKQSDADLKAEFRWHAIEQELNQGWSGGMRVGEVLGWELQHVLEAADREPNKDAVIAPVLTIFALSGLDPASARLSDSALKFGLLLSLKGRYADLRELYKNCPSPKLVTAFADAAHRALPQQLDDALKLLTFLPENMSAKIGPAADCAAEAVSVLTKARRFPEALALLTRYPTTRGFVNFCNEITPDAIDPAGAAAFYNDVLGKISAALPLDNAAQHAFEEAAVRLGKYLLDNDRAAELIPLHDALRLGAKFDPRLAPLFGDAVDKLSASPEPADEDLALKLLKHGAEHVSRTSPYLLKAASEMAGRKQSIGDDAFCRLLLKIKDACPAADLSQYARQALRTLAEARRYEDAVAFFAQARVKFLNDGPALLPDTIAALENIDSVQRERRLDALWVTVHDELKKLDDESPARLWKLEFGDILLALSNWDAARKHYQELAAFQESDATIAARAALRLIALKLARPDAPAGDDPAPVLSAPGSPEELKLAGQLLALPSTLKLENLPEKLKHIHKHELCEAEWDLIKGLRERQDGNDSAAQEDFKQASEKGQPSRNWAAAVASELLRPRKLVPEKEATTAAPQPKPEADEPP